MILTEDEAKTKWCPEARAAFYVGTDLVVANRDAVHRPHRHQNTLCLGSACMAWRVCSMDENGNRLGYCGKAGKP